MVSGTRENPVTELPWPRYFLAYFFLKFNQPLIANPFWGRLASAGRVILASWTTFLTDKRFGSPNRWGQLSALRVSRNA